MTSPHHYVESIPGSADAAPIEALWETSVLREGNYLVLPDGRMDLVVRCHEAGSSVARIEGIAIIGPSSRPASIPVMARQCFIGVRFSPGFGGCLGVAPVSVADTAIRGYDATKALGVDIAMLTEARGLPAIRYAIHDIALAQARLAQNIAASTIAAITLLHTSGGQVSIAQLAHTTGVPERSLRRRMQHAVGLSPKVFAGVLRFQHAMRRLEADATISLTDIAAECGYSDQAHLTREFQRLGGFTPGKRLPATLVTMLPGPLADCFNRTSR